MAAGNIDLNVVVRNQQALGRLNRDLNEASKSSLSLGRAAKAAAGALAAIGAASAIRGIVQTTARFQDLRTALTSVTGSAREGAAAFDFITDFSTRTQFSVEQLTTSFIKLKASGIQPTEELLTTFTDTAAVTTDQIGTLEAITDLFARTVSGGLGLEELNRLADRGVPVFRILQETLGITRLEISEFGKTAEGARKITDALAKGINKEFGGATQRLLPNLSVAFSNFGIAIDNAADKLGQGFAPELTTATNELTKLIEANERAIISFGQGLGEALTFTIKNVDGLTFAFTTLYAVFGKSPFGRIISGLTAIGVLGGKIADEFKETRQAFKDAVREAEGLTKIKNVFDFDDQTESIRVFGEAVSQAAMDTGDFNEQLEKANKAAYDKATATEKLRKEMDALKKELEDNYREAQRLEASFEQNALYAALKQVTDQGTLLEMKTAVLADGFRVFGQTAASELTDVILDAKSLDEALGNIARATLRALIQGFINLGITIFILEPLEKFIRRQIGNQQKLNRELKTEIALRTVLAFFGGGGGGIPFFANGGRTPANQPIIVGERGPELFVPNTAGEVIPNNELGVGTGDGGGAGGDNINVTFNINTIDATDFDTLLTTRQDLIIGLINRGLAERGKRSLTA